MISARKKKAGGRVASHALLAVWARRAAKRVEKFQESGDIPAAIEAQNQEREILCQLTKAKHQETSHR